MDTRLDDIEWLRTQYASHSLEQIGDDLGVHRNTVRNRMIKFGIERRKHGEHFKGRPKSLEQRTKMAAARKAYWDAHPNREEFKVKLSRTKTKTGIKCGYRWIYVPGIGSIAEHRYLMEKLLGRSLQPHEHIHHRDGDTLNNSLDNLELLTNAEHSRHHHADRKRDERGRYI